MVLRVFCRLQTVPHALGLSGLQSHLIQPSKALEYLRGTRWLSTIKVLGSSGSQPNSPNKRTIHTSSVQFRVQAAKYKPTQYKTKPLTYEMAFGPAEIGVVKSWNSWNTSNLLQAHSIDQKSQITVWDIFIRRFMYGTWHNLFVSEIIIKRRHNVIYIAGIVQQTIPVRKMYFLIGYTEEFLSYFLKCPIKMEIQSVNSKKDIVFKYI